MEPKRKGAAPRGWCVNAPLYCSILGHYCLNFGAGNIPVEFARSENNCAREILEPPA